MLNVPSPGVRLAADISHVDSPILCHVIIGWKWCCLGYYLLFIYFSSIQISFFVFLYLFGLPFPHIRLNFSIPPLLLISPIHSICLSLLVLCYIPSGMSDVSNIFIMQDTSNLAYVFLSDISNLAFVFLCKISNLAYFLMLDVSNLACFLMSVT